MRRRIRLSRQYLPEDVLLRVPSGVRLVGEHLGGHRLMSCDAPLLRWSFRCVALARADFLGVVVVSEPGLAGAHYRLGPVGDLQLGEDVGDVVAHRLGANVQSRCYLGIAAAPGYEV